MFYYFTGVHNIYNLRLSLKTFHSFITMNRKSLNETMTGNRKTKTNTAKHKLKINQNKTPNKQEKQQQRSRRGKITKQTKELKPDKQTNKQTYDFHFPHPNAWGSTAFAVT